MNQTTAEKSVERKAPARDGSLAPAASESVNASYLTHELRAPVTAIRLGLEILQEQTVSKLAGDEKQLLGLAVKNTMRLEGLINDIMDYSKVMAGKLKLSIEPCDARALVAETVASLKVVAQNKGVILMVEETRGALPRCQAEPRRIVQVLTNLISNAVKFTPTGGRVLVSARAGEGADSDKLVLRVEDTGCGIAEKDLEGVFSAFEQSSAGEKRSDGTGLGLTLARLMVSLHGGRIWAASRPGAGSVFSFTLPAVAEDLRLGARRFFQGRRLLRMAALVAALMAAAPSAAAEPASAKPAAIKKATIFLQQYCGLSRIPGLCSNAAAVGPRLTAWSWRSLKLEPQASFLPPRLLKVAKLFMDDMKVARIGDWTVQLRLEIK